MDLKELRNQIEQQKGKKEQIESQIQILEDSIQEGIKAKKRHEEAREIIRMVSLKTQEKLQLHISDITSLALNAVFDVPYELKATFVQRRNKTECDLKFMLDKHELDPMDEVEGGLIDVGSFALRVASWSMKTPQTNNVFLLDEPFKNLSIDYMPRASEMIKLISKDLKLQFIINTHSEELAESADRIFRVRKHKKISHVTEE